MTTWRSFCNLAALAALCAGRAIGGPSLSDRTSPTMARVKNANRRAAQPTEAERRAVKRSKPSEGQRYAPSTDTTPSYIAALPREILGKVLALTETPARFASVRAHSALIMSPTVWSAAICTPAAPLQPALMLLWRRLRSLRHPEVLAVEVTETTSVWMFRRFAGPGTNASETAQAAESGRRCDGTHAMRHGVPGALLTSCGRCQDGTVAKDLLASCSSPQGAPA